MEAVKGWKEPINKKVGELKLGKSNNHHWIRQHAQTYKEVANVSSVHLQLTDGRA